MRDDEPTGHCHIDGAGRSDEVDQPPGATEVRHQPQPDLGQRKDGVVGGDSQVAGKCQLAAGPHRVALDHRDRHEVRSVPPGEGLLEQRDLAVERLVVEAGQLGSPLPSGDVSSDRKARSSPAENDGPSASSTTT